MAARRNIVYNPDGVAETAGGHEKLEFKNFSKTSKI
jgi:hypothetical protein